MAHHTAKAAYDQLVNRLNKFPQGAPPSETLYQILKMLFSEEEASLVAKLPIRAFTAKEAAKRWGENKEKTEEVLRGLASRCILLDIRTDEEVHYVLPPPMAGFFEFSMMRLRGDVDQKLLGQLYYQYLNVEEDFVKELFTGTDTKLGRAYVNEGVLSSDQEITTLDFERASHVIADSKHMGISMCYCRHKMEHAGTVCDAPMDICMTFGNTADALIRSGYARRVDKSEGMELLHEAYENNLVQFGENVRTGVNFICNCCGCCCEALLAQKRFAYLNPIVTTKYLAVIDQDDCVNCGKCVKACPINAIDGDDQGTEVVSNLCIGCGVCLRNCPTKALGFVEREERIITPANSVHRVVLMAIDRGQLQDLIFDNDALMSHRAMAAILSAVLKLSPVKRALASDQVRSVYLERLIERVM